VRPRGGGRLFARYPARQSRGANEDRARPGRSHDQIANVSRRKNQTSQSRCLEQRRSSCACGAGCEFAGTVASGKMDEKLNENAAETAAESVAAIDDRGSEPASGTPATKKSASAARTPARTQLSINELEKLDDLLPVARDFNLHLHPARSRHHHILDIARAAHR